MRRTSAGSCSCRWPSRRDCLGRLIAAFLLDNKRASLLLDGFNAPLGTFLSRTKAANALGLISDVQFADLEKLRSIRNEFAHTWDQISLSTQSIADRIRAMTPSRIPSSNRVGRLLEPLP